MARKLSKEASIVLCNGPINLNYAVTSISAETTDEEVLKQSLRSKSPPDVTIHVRGSAPLSFGTSLVSVGNMVYCIGGSNSDKSSGFLASKEVRRFDPNKPELELDCNHPPMNQGRFFPAVVALQMIIYVFGGLSQTDSNNSPYAECLDTKKPKHRQNAGVNRIHTQKKRKDRRGFTKMTSFCSSTLVISSPSSSSSTPSTCASLSSSSPVLLFSTRRMPPCNASSIQRRPVARMGEEEKLTRRNPLDFPIEWERPKPGRRPDIFPQFSPMKTPLPPPMPYDPPEEDEEEEEKKEEEEEDPEKEEGENPESRWFPFRW